MIDLKEKHFVEALFPDIKWIADSELETWRCYLLRERVELKMTKRPVWEVDHVEAWLSVLEDEVARRKLLAKEGAPPYKGYDTIHDHSVEELRRFYVGDNFIRLFQLVTGFEVLPVHTGERWKYRCKAHGEDRNPSGVLYVNEGRYWCFACLPTGTLVKTSEGIRPIEAIQQGDLVYTGDGHLHPVRRAFSHGYEDDLVRIRGSVLKTPLLLSLNHKVPVLLPRSKKLVYRRADELKVAQYLLYPACDMQLYSGTISTTNIWKVLPGWIKKKGFKPRALPSKVNQKQFGEWLGWYLAEGSSTDRTVRFSLHSKETKAAARLEYLTQALFGSHMSRYVKGTKLDIFFCHALLAKWLPYHCGKGALHKHIPEFVSLWSSQAQLLLLQSLLKGDGTISALALNMLPQSMGGYHCKPNWKLKTNSADLASDVLNLALKNGVLPTIRDYCPPSKNRSWTVTFPGYFEQDWGQGYISLVENRITEIDHTFYKGQVHNLEVEDDHTYLTCAGVVCNCGQGGDLINLVQIHHQCNFKEAIEWLEDQARPREYVKKGKQWKLKV